VSTRPSFGGGVYGLVLDYHVTIQSKEMPAFSQYQQVDEVVGVRPDPGELIGGVDDWSLFRTLDDWTKPRRVAYLGYMAKLDNPSTLDASTLAHESSPGSWWSDDGPERNRALAIGARAGLSAPDLVWTEFWNNGALVGHLLGYDGTRGRFLLLATGTYDAANTIHLAAVRAQSDTP
jgi:hypothetical protein